VKDDLLLYVRREQYLPEEEIRCLRGTNGGIKNVSLF
jgi:hypothetical protein